MPKIATVHQPNYLPWIGLFSKLSLSDCFIIGDTFALGDRSVVPRNKIRTDKGWSYLTVPIGHGVRGQRICDIKLPPEHKWRKDHWRAICANYQKTDFFTYHKDFFEKVYNTDFEFLWQINEEIMFYLLKCFEIKVDAINASALSTDANLAGTDLIISLVKSVGADVYLSGPSGRNYLEFEKFPKNNIDLKFFEFEHPVYKQRYLEFEPNMSAIDLLFNMGIQSGEIIRKSCFIDGL